MSAHGPEARAGLFGSAQELTRLGRVSRSALSTRSSGDFAAAVDSILSRFVAATMPARDRLMATDVPARTAAAEVPRSRRTTVVLGYVFLTGTLFGSLFAGLAVFPPARRYEVELAFAVEWSTVAGYVTIVFALLSCLLPAWGTMTTRSQVWKTHAAAAVVLGIGLLLPILRSAEDLGEVGDDALSARSISTVAALGAVTLATVVRYARARRPIDERSPDRVYDPDADYLRAIAPTIDRTRAELDSLARNRPQEWRAVDEAWRAGIEESRRQRRLSARTAARARETNAYAWQLELAADPELDSWPGPYRAAAERTAERDGNG